jgi:hypothetical protein
MEEPLPQDVLPRAGCRPGPGQRDKNRYSAYKSERKFFSREKEIPTNVDD